VPDYTFDYYPEVRTSAGPDGSTRWLDLSKSLVALSESRYAWAHKEPTVYWRGANTGARRGGNAQRHEFTSQLTASKRARSLPPEWRLPDGVSVDAELVKWGGFAKPKSGNFATVETTCSHKYLPHLAGWAYSAGLKYKLLCGSVVINVAPVGGCVGDALCVTSREWYYDELDRVGGLVNVDMGRHGNDTRAFMRVIRGLAADDGKAERIGTIGRDWGARNLGGDGLDCFWLALLAKQVEVARRVLRL